MPPADSPSHQRPPQLSPLRRHIAKSCPSTSSNMRRRPVPDYHVALGDRRKAREQSQRLSDLRVPLATTYSNKNSFRKPFRVRYKCATSGRDATSTAGSLFWWNQQVSSDRTSSSSHTGQWQQTPRKQHFPVQIRRFRADAFDHLVAALQSWVITD